MNNNYTPNVIAQSIEDFERDQTLMLKASIQLEASRKEIRELQSDMAHKDGIIAVLKDYCFEHLAMFESIFDTDEGSFKKEDMAKYLILAEHMKLLYNRNSHYINRVRERLNALPF